MLERVRKMEFRKERTKELQGLLANGTVVPADHEAISKVKRVFGYRFIDALKRGEKN